MDGAEQPFLHGLITVADHRLERRDHVADHISGASQQHSQAADTIEPRHFRPRQCLDQQRMLRDRKDVSALRLPRSSATRARPCARPRPRRRGARVQQVRPPSRQHVPPCAPAFRTGARLCPSLACKFGDCRVSMQSHEMVADHADRLHERTRWSARRTETARDELLRDLLRARSLRHLIGGPEIIELRFSVEVVPQQVENPGPLSMIASHARADDTAPSILKIAHDAGVLHQRIQFALG